MPIGTSIRPVLRTLPARAKILVPLLFSVPSALNQPAPCLDDGGNGAEGLDVVDQRRAGPRDRSQTDREGVEPAGRAGP